MDYKIISASSVNELESTVKSWLAVGWKPQGGVSFQMLIIGEDISMKFIQALYSGA